MGIVDFHSNYYEKNVVLTEDEAETLIRIYVKVAKKLSFSPDADTVELIMEDTNAYDTVAYHVENFGQNENRFNEIKHLFEEEDE